MASKASNQDVERRLQDFLNTEIEPASNKDHIAEFVDYLRADRNVSNTRIIKYIGLFKQSLQKFIDFDLNEGTKGDVRSAVGRLEGSDYSAWSKHDHRIAIKKYYKTMYESPEDRPKEIRRILNAQFLQAGRNVENKHDNEPLTPDDVLAMVDAAKNYRDRLIPLFFFETGARIGEITQVKLKDVQLERKYADVTLPTLKNDKGPRTLTLTRCVALLRDWLEHHPRHEPDGFQERCRAVVAVPDRDRYGRRHHRALPRPGVPGRGRVQRQLILRRGDVYKPVSPIRSVMSVGDVYEAEPAGVSYVDTGLYGVDGYGSIYIVDGEEPAIVDTGMGTNYAVVLDALEEQGIDHVDLEHILLTHVHLDHAGSAGYLAEACPDATVHVHERGAPHLVDPDRLVTGTKRAVGDQWKHYAEPVPVDAARIDAVADGDVVDLGDREVEVFGAPGHAPHQVMYHDRSTDSLFTGDAAGIAAPGEKVPRVTSPPPDFDLEQCVADVRMVEAIWPDTLCFGHFGDRPYEPELMQGYRERLADWVADVETQYAGDRDAVVEHFVDAADTEVWGEERMRAETGLNVDGVLVALERDA